MLNYQVRSDLTTLTKYQKQQDIEQLAKRSLTRLRKDQFVFDCLLDIAHRLGNQFAIRNLEVKREIYACAIMFKHYGEY